MNTLTVTSEEENGWKLENGEDMAFLPKEGVPAGREPEVDEKLKVFIFTDREGNPIATLNIAAIHAGETALLPCKRVEEDCSFVDIGMGPWLPIPREYQRRVMVFGEPYVVYVDYRPELNRLIGVTALEKIFPAGRGDFELGQEVQLQVYDYTDIGMMVLIDKVAVGLLYFTETPQHLEMGEITTGYIKRVREDGKIDVTLNPVGYDRVMSNTPEVLKKLKEAGGFLPYNDKTDSFTVQQEFGMSRKAFKKIIGGLYKHRIIEITSKGMKLIDPDA
ncbi:MAG: S1 RNA-binding domain-containing protein [Desulfovibrio sp.]